MNALSIVLLVIVVAAVLFFFAARLTGGTPSVFGFYIFRVTSDSMEPTFTVGDVILVKSTPADEIKKDDIITFKSEEAQTYGREVTHRVVREPEFKNGKYYYQTRGDAPKSSLDRIITYDQVQGKYLQKLVIIGALYNFFCTPIGVVVLIGIVLLLFGYEMVALMVSNKKIDKADEALFASLDEKLNMIEAEENKEKETDEKNEEANDEKIEIEDKKEE